MGLVVDGPGETFGNGSLEHRVFVDFVEHRRHRTSGGLSVDPECLDLETGPTLATELDLDG